MTHSRRQKKKSPQRNLKKGFFLMATLIFFLATLNILFSCHLATYGEEVGALEKEIHALDKDNQSFKKKIVDLGSYAAIHQRAQKLGFREPSSVIYLEGQPPLAMR